MKTLSSIIVLCTFFFSFQKSNCQCEVLDGMGFPINENNFPLNENLIPNPEFEDVISFGWWGEFECWEAVDGMSTDAWEIESLEDICNDQIGSYNNDPTNSAVLGIAASNDNEMTEIELPVSLIPGNYDFNIWSRFCEYLGSDLPTNFAVILSTNEASYAERYGEVANGTDSPNVEVILVQELTQNDNDWAQYGQEIQICRDDLDLLSILAFDPDNIDLRYLIFDGISLELLSENQIEYSIDNTENESCWDSSGLIEITIPESSFILWEFPDQTTSIDEDLTSLSAGIYTAVIQDFSCDVFSTVEFEIEIENEVDEIDFSIEEVVNETCSDAMGSIDITIPETTTVQWELAGSTFALTEDLDNLSAGVYFATIEDPSCPLTSVEFEIEIEDQIVDCCFDPLAPQTHILDGELVSWDQLDTEILADVIIHSGGQLNIESSTLNLATDIKIRIEPGGQLEINNSVLDANCDDQWGGIEVWGDEDSNLSYDLQGVIEITQSTIKNAKCAVLFGATNQNEEYILESGGAFGYIFNSKFVNNARDIHALKYLDSTAGIKVRDTFFEIDENYFDSAEFPLRRVSLHQRMYFWFEDCHFLNSCPELLEDPEHGYELTGIYAENSPYSFKSENPEVINSEVVGFSYGTRTNGGANNSTYIIRDVRFENYRDVFFRNGYYSGVYENEFYPLPQDYPDPSFPSWLESQGYNNGVALIPGTYAIYYDGFFNRGDVQDNFIDMQGLSLSSGIVIRNTFNSMLPVYRNEIRNSESGLKFLDQNRMIFQQGIPGLDYECNELVNNELDVEINAQVNNLAQGVNLNQGSIVDGSPRNQFDNTYFGQDLIQEHIFNYVSASSHNYYKTNISWEPESFEMANVSPLIANTSYLCDSQVPENLVINGGGNDAENIKNDLLITYNAKKYEWELLVDGGDTDALTNEVIHTEFSEALELYYALMSKSPNLSEQVMLEAIEKEFDLPMVLLKQILTSNPQAAKSNKVQKKLDERLIPLPNFMRQEIMTGLEWVSQKEELENEMHRIRKEYRQIEFAEISVILSDESIENPGELIQNILINSAFEEDIFESISRLVNSNDYDGAILALQSEQLIAGQGSDYHQDLSELEDIISLKSDIELGLVNLDPNIESLLSEIARNTESPSASIAQNILEKKGAHICLEELNYPKIEFSDRSFVSMENSETRIKSVKIYPNPAQDMLVIEKDDLPLTKESFYIVFDSNAKEVLKVKTVEGFQQVLDISTLPSGKYSLTLVDMNDFITTIDFIKL